MSILYCDCFSGISGDMFLGAMLDAGLPLTYLTEQLTRLGLPEFKQVKASKVPKGALQATLLEFELQEQHGHDHDHHHRHLSDILAMIAASGLPEPIQRTSTAIFQKLGEAEAKVHGTSIEEVHFHEVGAVDSILDIVGAAVALHHFDIQQVYASALPLGSGTVQTEHGLLPLPAPATLELLNAVHAPVAPSQSTKEMVTPTGAAILATLAKFEQPAMRLQHTGMGAGQRELSWPNILRVMIGALENSFSGYVEIETNIDDMNPQFFAPVMQHLFEQGALDVYFTAIQMKKNRPAIKVSVIARREDEILLSQLLLRETSTLGVRVNPVSRHEAEREFRKVSTRYGETSVKLKLLDGKVVQASPEYDQCAELAKRLQLPVAEVYREVLLAAATLINS
jgi:pyridinium-3,5-bisthiocarboxylic acid mononucleotide nickel chelatase